MKSNNYIGPVEENKYLFTHIRLISMENQQNGNSCNLIELKWVQHTHSTGMELYEAEASFFCSRLIISQILCKPKTEALPTRTPPKTADHLQRSFTIRLPAGISRTLLFYLPVKYPCKDKQFWPRVALISRAL